MSRELTEKHAAAGANDWLTEPIHLNYDSLAFLYRALLDGLREREVLRGVAVGLAVRGLEVLHELLRVVAYRAAEEAAHRLLFLAGRAGVKQRRAGGVPELWLLLRYRRQHRPRHSMRWQERLGLSLAVEQEIHLHGTAAARRRAIGIRAGKADQEVYFHVGLRNCKQSFRKGRKPGAYVVIRHGGEARVSIRHGG